MGVSTTVTPQADGLGLVTGVPEALHLSVLSFVWGTSLCSLQM